ncbi:hypothetical protein [Streptomyces otsuchiensis]|uniref:hypothetical protein n=1 Tax=Streptomyces otsuchiensis TaxID=2681388 RepID=UPI001031F024|nr:hypothetical protein [Streptomyces otsuchiensis]
MPTAFEEYPGQPELESMIAGLVRRPRFTDRDGERSVRGDRPLPLVCLLHDGGRRRALPSFDKRVLSRTSHLPYAYVDAEAVAGSAGEGGAPEGRDREPSLLPLLEAARFRLDADRFGPDHRPSFDRYGLIDWLTRQPTPPRGRRRNRMTELLRQWSGRAPAPSDRQAIGEALDEIPSATVRSGLRLLVTLGGWLGLRITGVRRQARWMMRQPYLVPAHSHDFEGFAERLTVDRREAENPEHVEKLLVHAFLEDLRAGYRRRHRRVLPRRSGWRRTAYVVLLLDNVTGRNGGWELLRLINEVRNETGEHDPLLVVAAGDELPEPRPGKIHHPSDSRAALRRWDHELPRKRQQFDRYARYLWLGAPAAPMSSRRGPAHITDSGTRPAADRAPAFTDGPDRDGDGDQPDGFGWAAGGGHGEDRFWPRRAPWPARRGVVETALALALVLTLLPVVFRVDDSWSAGCSYFRAGFEERVSVRVVELGRGDVQCVGYSDSAAQVFGTDKRLRTAQLTVFEENEKAERLHRDQPERPLLTLVHFVGLTHRDVTPDTDHASAEELEGLVLRQREQNNEEAPSEPLLRVVVANGGDEMGEAELVAREMLAPLAESDPTVVGVLGLDRTIAETKLAIAELGRAGVPVIGTTLTGTGLAEVSPLYFQMVPDNDRQALLIAAYAEHLRAERVTIHHPPLERGDAYVETLVAGTTERVTESGREVTAEGWTDSPGELTSLCADGEDRSRELVYYVGREADFGGFLRQVTSGCTRTDRLPQIVASDSVSRFVAQPERRANTVLAGVRISYVGLGALVTLAGEPCQRGQAPPGTGSGTPLNVFCAGFAKLHSELAGEIPEMAEPAAPGPAERTGVAYDAAGLMIRAVATLHRTFETGEHSRPAHRAAVAQQIRERVFKGATGEVDFRRDRIGNERNLAVLTIENINDLEAAPTCSFLIGTLHDGDQPAEKDTGCPL